MITTPSQLITTAPTTTTIMTSTPTNKRPISTAESANPREFQLNQLRRRFRPTETTDATGKTSLTFGLAPSDPDFPFEMDKLECVLHVPASYPAPGRPTLRVLNEDMGEAFRENVARGFDDIVDSTLRTGGRGTLLTWMNSLDRHLERLLTSVERGPVLKFVGNAGGREEATEKLAERLQAVPVPLGGASGERSAGKGKGKGKVTASAPAPPAPPVKVFSAEEKAEAQKRRALETRQIEARLGRLPLFQKSKDGLSFIVPIQPPKVERLPLPLRSVKTVKLLVPTLYPLEYSAVELRGVDSKEAQSVEAGFAQWIGGNLQLNLMSQVNYLTSNMHNFAKTPVEEEAPEPVKPAIPDPVPEEQPASIPQANPAQSEDKPHVHVVPRPPEWTVGNDDSGSDTEFSTSEEDYSNEDEEDGGAPVPSLPEPTAERGVALSFPFLELYGIELLDLVALSISVKCERCKEELDIKHVPQAKDKSDALSPKVESCKKCANTMSIGFRRQLIHPHSNRAGYLDLDGCIIGDLLPSSFIPTCAECSTSFPAPGVVAVRGESASAGCRQCHRKMVLKIPEVKFLRVGTAAFSNRDRAPQRKKPREVLGIVAGQELPRRGRCTHYAKSFRWFRFSCCAKVYPCDKCHDAAEDHPNEHANRMLCGYCSREQHYRPEDCGTCHAILIGKAGSGFWEGGKGTRNRVLMSRKDPRKFKRRPGSKVGGGSKK